MSLPGPGNTKITQGSIKFHGLGSSHNFTSDFLHSVVWSGSDRCSHSNHRASVTHAVCHLLSKNKEVSWPITSIQWQDHALLQQFIELFHQVVQLATAKGMDIEMCAVMLCNVVCALEMPNPLQAVVNLQMMSFVQIDGWGTLMLGFLGRHANLWHLDFYSPHWVNLSPGAWSCI